MIYIIIPVYNRKKFTKQCLDSLRKQSFKDFKIIVVDDCSTDGTFEMLKKEYPEVIVLRGDGNLWWTASINLGIKHAIKNGAKYVLTLNDDTIAPDNFVEKMVEGSKTHPNALIGALNIDYYTRKPSYGGEIVDWQTRLKVQLLLDTLPPKQHKGLHKVSLFPGRGLWIPIHVFDTIGLFDQKNFPHYYADFDFTYKAHRNGFDIYCNYDAVIYMFPEESGEMKQKKTRSLKNFYNHLFGIKGGGNLRNFTLYTLRYSPKTHIPRTLLEGYARRIVGYWIN